MSKNPYYWTCPLCGANLDPGESCDCDKNEQASTQDYRDVPHQNINQERNQKHEMASVNAKT